MRRRKWMFHLLMLVPLLFAFSPIQASYATNLSEEPVISERQASQPTSLSGSAAVEKLKKTGQYIALEEAITKARYEIRSRDKDDGLWLYNPANNLHATIHSQGAEITVYHENKHNTFSWKLSSLGYGIQQTPISPGKLWSKDQKAEILRRNVTEWFFNTPDGLEHGFVLSSPPASHSYGEMLRVEMMIEGDLTAQVDKHGQLLTLYDQQGKAALNYDKLKVWDAKGQILPSHLETRDGKLYLYVDDTFAQYPLTIDPTFRRFEHFQFPFSNFGYYTNLQFIAMHGNTVIIGSAEEADELGRAGAGAVYVLVRSGNTWVQQARLIASNREGTTTFPADIYGGDIFGISADIFDDTIIVGAPGEDSSATGINGDQADNSAGSSGAAYVFVRSGTTWSQQAYIKPSNTGGGFFGYSVAIHNDTIVVGAPRESSEATGVNGDQNNGYSAYLSGAAYVFVREGSTWSQEAYLKASDTDIEDSFGTFVDIYGNTIAVSAPNEDSGSIGINGDQTSRGARTGAVYIFARKNSEWTQEAFVKPPVTQQYSFGRGIALSEHYLAIASTNIVDILTQTDSQWNYQARLGPFPSFLNDGIDHISASGDLITLSTGIYEVDYFTSKQTFIFAFQNNTWLQEARIAGMKGEAFQGTVALIDAGDLSNYRGVHLYNNTPPTSPTCAGLFQEAENAILGQTFFVGDDPAASGGKYLSTTSAWAPNNVMAEYCFNIPATGKYRIKGKVYGADTLSDSFVVTVDGISHVPNEGAPSYGFLWDIQPNTSYQLDYVSDRGKADPVEVVLSQGWHYLRVYKREAGTRLDTLELEPVIETPPQYSCDGLFYEAEEGIRSGNFVIAKDPDASNGQYVLTPESSGHFWNGPANQHKVTYCFNVVTAGSYRIKGNTYGIDALSDSFYVRVDDTPVTGYLWDVLISPSYSSDFVNARGIADPVELLLSSGQHTVTIYAREDGTRLDTIELQLVNAGVDPTPTCAGLTQEAESGALIGNFVAASDATASGGKFVHTPNGSGDFWSGANPRQKAIYCFNVATAGTYRIDGKVLGADTLSDSFYVQVDGAPSSGYVWDVKSGTSYTLDSVSDRNKADPVVVTLAAGQHTVTVYTREDGTRLDTISLAPITPSPQSRAIPPLAQGVHGTLRIDTIDLTQEIDFSQITVTLVDAETNGLSFRQQVTADLFGQFYFDGMTPGQYKVQLTLPNKLVAATSEVSVTASADELVETTFDVSVQPDQVESGSKTYLPLINR